MASQAGLASGAGRLILRDWRRPSSRSAWRTQFRIDCAVGSNFSANSSGFRPARTSSTSRRLKLAAYGGWDLGIRWTFAYTEVCRDDERPLPGAERDIPMSEADNLFGEEHIRRYRETDGEVGHIWRRGSKILLLTTKGRRSGESRTTPLIYEEADGAYVVVASKGGAPEHPGWYRNLVKEPIVELQVKGDVFPARARTPMGQERERLWKLAAQQWPDYDEYQKRTDRKIPVIVLERVKQ
jgi:deazaflavin-dependent oxidoreductase (nitroreductase family)